ncbi:MAG: 7-cyano-7-deazaguanine synthase [Phycisphaerales bacterium]|nr:7-cyano-7-deazaguanine synthase [Phycisphaerales bacterium]
MSACLIISDGSLPGMVAAAIESERRVDSQPKVWAGDPLGQVVGPTRSMARLAVQSQADALGLELLDRDWIGSDGTGAGQSLALLSIAQQAAAMGVRRVVWAVQYPLLGVEPDLDRIAATVDRCLLISRLVSLDLWDHPNPSVPEVRIEMPLVDLSDTQIADLALDLGAPIASAWWMEGVGEPAQAEQRRWLPLLAELGWAAQSV